MMRQTRFLNAAQPACFLIAAIIFLTARPAPAQDLHAYYDLFSDSIYYQKEGQPVKNPKIRKGDRVVVHFTEFNPFLYAAKAGVEQRHVGDWAGNVGLSAFAGLVPGLSGLLPGAGLNDPNAPQMGLLDIPLLRLGQNSMKLKDLFANSRGAEQLLEQARQQLQASAQIQSDMAEIFGEIQRLERSEQVARMALKHLDAMMHNPQTRPSLVKKVAMEYRAEVFPDKEAAALQVEDAFRWQERPALKRRLLQDLADKQKEFDAQMVQMTPITRQLSELDLGSEELTEFAGELRGVEEKRRALQVKMSDYLNHQTEQKTPPMSLEELMTLQLRFRELAGQSFSFDCAVEIENDLAIVTATFSPRDSLDGVWRQNDRSPRVKTVKLETRGGLRISTGLGLGFSQFFDAAEKYSVRDNKIVAETGGSIQPALGTFIHFYGGGRGGVRLAGTFGLGIPLGGGSNISSLHFFLGPSLLFGRGQRIVLSTGLTSGPVERLGKGFKAGDEFDPNVGDIPLRSRYELGYFVGVSFNLGGK